MSRHFECESLGFRSQILERCTAHLRELHLCELLGIGGLHPRSDLSAQECPALPARMARRARSGVSTWTSPKSQDPSCIALLCDICSETPWNLVNFQVPGCQDHKLPLENECDAPFCCPPTHRAETLPGRHTTDPPYNFSILRSRNADSLVRWDVLFVATLV